MPARILIVDDAAEILMMLRTSLEIENYEVWEARSGEDALDILQEKIPDLIILDIFLPGIDGYEVCRKIRERNLKVPIIMLTAHSEVEQRVKGLKAGADDYLGKPFSISELLARVKVQLRHTEEAKLMAEEIIKKKWDEINEGLKLAQRLQQPLAVSPSFPGIDLGIQYLPVGKIGGDFYTIQETIPGKVTTILIGDVVGKGVTAILLMASTLHLLYQLMSTGMTPSRIFYQANEILRRDFQDIESFVAAFMGVWDRQRSKFKYCNAGHQLPILIPRRKLNHKFLRTSGFFLGAFQDGNYKEEEIDLEEGDRIFFYTDGLIDLRNKEGKNIDLRWIYKRILRNFSLPVRDLSELILKEIHNFVGKDPILRDDLTFFLLEVK